jgi:hypothetical protein
VCLVCWLVAGPNSRVYVFAHFTHAVVWVLYARVYGTHTSRGCEWFETCDMRPRRRNSRQYCCLDVQKIVPNKRKVLKIFHALTCCDAACGHTTPHHTTPHHTTPHHTTPHHTTPHHTTPHHTTRVGYISITEYIGASDSARCWLCLYTFLHTFA